jgi:hypothetical protein
LQYGFVTIFVAAFPLAPFFALLNNVLEMRLDARKLITFYRRPVGQRVRDITSEFIPRLIYSMYWHILAARLAFVVVFENIVTFIIIIIKWCIPDIPGDLKDRIRREAYITNEIIIKQETIRAQHGYLCE